MSGRIRSIKPQIIEDEKVGPVSDTAFRLFASMIVLADDHGNVRADVRWLTSQVWWAHEHKPNVLAALLELTRASLIRAYGVRGGTYVHLNGWGKHQRIDNAGKGRVPTPNDPDAKELCEDLTDFAEFRGESPRTSEEFRSEKDMDMDIGAAASPPRTSKPKGRPKRAATHPIPPDWNPSEQAQAKAKELRLDCVREAEQFRDHHTAKGSVFSDWDAAFRTWLRNAAKWRDERGGKPATKQPKIGDDGQWDQPPLHMLAEEPS